MYSNSSEVGDHSRYSFPPTTWFWLLSLTVPDNSWILPVQFLPWLRLPLPYPHPLPPSTLVRSARPLPPVEGGKEGAGDTQVGDCKEKVIPSCTWKVKVVPFPWPGQKLESTSSAASMLWTGIWYWMAQSLWTRWSVISKSLLIKTCLEELFKWLGCWCLHRWVGVWHWELPQVSEGKPMEPHFSSKQVGCEWSQLGLWWLLDTSLLTGRRKKEQHKYLLSSVHLLYWSRSWDALLWLAQVREGT